MTIELIPEDERMLAALASAEAFQAAYGVAAGPIRHVLSGVVEQTLRHQARVGSVAPWVGYAAHVGGEVVGSCGFTGNPTPEGEVEIAYFAFAPHEGRGHGTGMARALVELARGRPEVRTVLAFTLPAESASTAILRKLGFAHDGLGTDPDEGTVWRWRLAV